MTEEIKGILDSIREIIKSNRENDFDRIIMLGDDIDKILNYITNLQNENKELRNQLDFIDEQNKYIDKLEKMIKDYKSRNEKAIEWCKCVINSKTTVGELPNGKRTDIGYCLDLAEPLLNILKGVDEE